MTYSNSGCRICYFSPKLLAHVCLAMIVGLAQRALVSLTIVPSARQWYHVAGITLATTSMAGLVAAGTGFVDPMGDWDPPTGSLANQVLRPLSALVVPALVEETIWRGAFLSPVVVSSSWYGWAGGVLILHVLFHPIAARTFWPRGQHVFDDARFLLLATIVLGGATLSFGVSGGSAWAAAWTHGIPVALWRDFWGGEAKLLGAHPIDARNEEDHDDSGHKRR